VRENKSRVRRNIPHNHNLTHPTHTSHARPRPQAAAAATTMPKALSTSKVTKSIARKTGKHGPKRNKPLHASSRDAGRLSRAAARDSRVAATQASAQKARDALIARVAHFHALAVAAAAADDDACWSDDMLAAHVDAFVGRAGPALEALARARRDGRPATAEELRMRNAAEREAKELEAGFWCPDVRDPEARKMLREWKGDWGGLGTVKFVRVRKDGAVVEDRWPPR